MKLLLIFISMAILLSCSSGSLAPKQSYYCKEIDSLINERYRLKSGNFFANQIIPKIEKESKIEASCQKGTYGYLYSSDSLFDSDIKKWREYFKCK